jgi:aspartate racemase
MGPLATADFMLKVIAETSAERDQDHVPLIVQSFPQIPDRSQAIRTGDDAPLPYLIDGVQRLVAAGASVVIVPCNTAHHWFDAVSRAAAVPLLHIADAVCDALDERGLAAHSRIALLGTTGTLASGFYARRLEARGYRIGVACSHEHEADVQRGIEAAKAGRIVEAGVLFNEVVADLHRKGAEAVILACTEIPAVLDRVGCPHGRITIDSTRALARQCVSWYKAKGRRVARTPDASLQREMP